MRMSHLLFRPKIANRPAKTKAATIMAVTAPRAAETGKPGEGAGVGGSGVLVEVRVVVGQAVMVGSPVGVEVGKVGVGVNAARTMIF